MTTYSSVDKFIMTVDQALVTLFGHPPKTERPYPALDKLDESLSETNRQESARCMRANHAKGICAQALYQSQALTTSNQAKKISMQQSARQGSDHLNWCEQRLKELGGRKSLLNPAWYAGSFTIGTLASLASDHQNSGFVAASQKQAAQHLKEHLNHLDSADERSRAIIEQIKVDVGHHATAATHAAGSPLPEPILSGMKMMSKFMTKTAYWI